MQPILKQLQSAKKKLAHCRRYCLGWVLRMEATKLATYENQLIVSSDKCWSDIWR